MTLVYVLYETTLRAFFLHFFIVLLFLFCMMFLLSLSFLKRNVYVINALLLMRKTWVQIPLFSRSFNSYSLRKTPNKSLSHVHNQMVHAKFKIERSTKTPSCSSVETKQNKRNRAFLKQTWSMYCRICQLGSVESSLDINRVFLVNTKSAACIVSWMIFFLKNIFCI